MADEDDETSATSGFREAIARARREPVAVTPQFDPVPRAASVPPRWDVRVERLRGPRRRRQKLLARLGRKGWELVAVESGLAYLRRVRRR